jgi:hypothetical protein
MVETPDSQVFFSKCPKFGGLGEHCIVVRVSVEKVEIDFKISPDEPTREVSLEEFMDTTKREGGGYEPH